MLTPDTNNTAQNAKGQRVMEAQMTNRGEKKIGVCGNYTVMAILMASQGFVKSCSPIMVSNKPLRTSQKRHIFSESKLHTDGLCFINWVTSKGKLHFIWR